MEDCIAINAKTANTIAANFLAEKSKHLKEDVMNQIRAAANKGAFECETYFSIGDQKLITPWLRTLGFEVYSLESYENIPQSYMKICWNN